MKNNSLKNTGVRNPQGEIKDQDKHLAELEANGYEVIRTDNGIIINPPKNK
jgi:hypothetical protein